MTDYYHGDLPAPMDDIARVSKKLSLSGPEILKLPHHIKDPNAPKDRFNLVLIVVSIIGLVSILPASYFTTANEYWMYKFRNVSLNTTNADERTYLQKNFVSLTGIYNSIPTIFTNLISIFVAHKVSPKLRILSVMSVYTCVFGSLVVFACIDTDDWQYAFFDITVFSMVLITSLIQLFGGALFNLLTKLPPAYIRGFLVGQGCSTIFTATLRLVSIAILPTTTGSAIIYFTCGVTAVFLTTLSAAWAMNTDFFKYHTSDYKEEKKEPFRNAGDFWGTLKMIWPMMLLGVIMFMFPLPSIYNLVVSENYGDDGTTWGNKYFVTICTFWIPAVVNVFGRVIYNKLNWDWPVTILVIFTFGYQVVFTILMFVCNARPRTHLPVLLPHDWQYAIIMAVYAFISGFTANMTTIITIKLVPPNRAEFAMMLIFLSGSIFMLAFSPLGLLAVKML